MIDSSRQAETAPILVCGLGSIGLECVRALQSYAVPVRALDLRDVTIPGDVAPFVRGDCRDADALRRAGIDGCRAVVLVAGDVHANIEGALVARKLNAGARVVVRTAGESWSESLASVLGNFVALEPNKLAAGSLALAAIGTEMLGHFRTGDALLRALRHVVRAGDAWDGLTIDEAHQRGVVVLDVVPGEPRAEARGDLFFRFDPDHRIAAGDVLTVLAHGPADAARERKETMRARAARRPIALSRATAIAVAATGLLLVTVVVAVLLYPAADRSLSRADAFFSALVMMTGGTYADLFPPFHHFSDGMRAFSVLLSVIGTVGAGLLYAWITDQLLKARFRLPKRRPPPPQQGHVVVVGLGRVGRQATAHLLDLGVASAGIESRDLDDHALPPRVAVVRGSGAERAVLDEANLDRARGLLAATDADWINFEVAILARTMNPDLKIVIRARDPRFSDNVHGALAGVRVLCVPLLAAKAFAAAALGENVIDLFQMDGRTVFVIEYEVAPGDGLEGELLASIAEGYAVVPVALAHEGARLRLWSPADQARRVAAGDRLVVLGPSRSLQAIERRAPKEKTARLAITRLLSIGDPLALARVLAQQLGCSLEEAKASVATIPCELPQRLYPHHAHRIARELARTGAEATSVVD